MIVENIKIKTVANIEIDEAEAFHILCKTLDMDFVLDEDTKFIVKKNEYDENSVYIIRNGREEIYDERGDLFVALRNIAVNIFPNLYFRSDDYIYNS